MDEEGSLLACEVAQSCSSDDEQDNGRESNDETCPICLTDSIHPMDKAVTSCMHSFCRSCLAQWLEQKRVCPLCKRRVTGYLHTICSDTDYQEVEIPPSPERPSTSDLQALLRALSRLGDSVQLAEQLARLGGAHGASAGPYATRWGPTTFVRASTHDPESGGHLQPQQRVEVLPAWRPQGGTRGRSRADAADSQSQPQPQPRPYFFRLQQRMSAGLNLSMLPPHASSTGTGPQPPQPGAPALGTDAASTAATPPSPEAARRHVYARGVWAAPVHQPTAGAGRPPVSRTRWDVAEPAQGSRLRLSGGSSGRYLEAWVDRELRALLQNQDVTIVRAFVLSLVATFGLTHNWSGSGAARDSSAGGASAAAAPTAASAAGSAAVGSQPVAAVAAAADAAQRHSAAQSPVEALRPFLFEHAAQFWHELRCFASSGLNIEAYDRAVRYLPAPGSGAPLPSSMQHGGRDYSLLASVRIASRWGLRAPQARPHLQQRAAARDVEVEVVDLSSGSPPGGSSPSGPQQRVHWPVAEAAAAEPLAAPPGAAAGTARAEQVPPSSGPCLPHRLRPRRWDVGPPASVLRGNEEGARSLALGDGSLQRTGAVAALAAGPAPAACHAGYQHIAPQQQQLSRGSSPAATYTGGGSRAEQRLPPPQRDGQQAAHGEGRAAPGDRAGRVSGSCTLQSASEGAHNDGLKPEQSRRGHRCSSSRRQHRSSGRERSSLGHDPAGAPEGMERLAPHGACIGRERPDAERQHRRHRQRHNQPRAHEAHHASLVPGGDGGKEGSARTGAGNQQACSTRAQQSTAKHGSERAHKHAVRSVSNGVGMEWPPGSSAVDDRWQMEMPLELLQ